MVPDATPEALRQCRWGGGRVRAPDASRSRNALWFVLKLLFAAGRRAVANFEPATSASTMVVDVSSRKEVSERTLGWKEKQTSLGYHLSTSTLRC